MTAVMTVMEPRQLDIVESYIASVGQDTPYKALHGLSGVALDDAVENMPDGMQKALKRAANIHAITLGKQNKPVEKKTATQVRTTEASRKVYEDLLAEEARAEDWNEAEWAVRMEYLSEMKEASSRGGCSGCAANAIKRKYFRKLQDLL